MIAEKIKNALQSISDDLQVSCENMVIEHPAELSHGDYATNIAFIIAKKLQKSPKETAEIVAERLRDLLFQDIDRIDVAGPGFINITLSSNFFSQQLELIKNQQSEFGRNQLWKDKKVMVEYTDPNPFKVMHIGHVMSNAIGESISRLYEYANANVVRANYQGDVGLHVAKALYGMQNLLSEMPTTEQSLSDRANFIGRAYAFGSKQYEDNDTAKIEIHELNKKIYTRSDDSVNDLYDKGKMWSLEHFEELYQKLGTEFTHYFFESETTQKGLAVVQDQLSKNVFEESDGAIVYKGEKVGLHTRVFINAQGLPTYEAKEIGLHYAKHEREPQLDLSIVVTADEQVGFMKVVLSALREFESRFADITRHVSHGMMRFKHGKMSSRTGDVITGESLIYDMESVALEKIQEHNRVLDQDLQRKLAEIIAVSAVKFSILKQSTDKHIIFDPEQSLSFEGDSGPYVQYTFARTFSLTAKARQLGLTSQIDWQGDRKVTHIERLLYRFPEVVKKAVDELAPHMVAGFAIDIAREFNHWYGQIKIVDSENQHTPHYLAIVEAVGIVLHNSLYILGIKSPDQM